MLRRARRGCQSCARSPCRVCIRRGRVFRQWLRGNVTCGVPQKAAQRFLMNNFASMGALIPDMSHLSGDIAPSILGGVERQVRLERPGIFIAGFVCKARSKLNPKSAGNLGCIQKESESTGVSFSLVAAYVKAHRPTCVVLENVIPLAQIVPETGISDAKFIVQFFERAGYVCFNYKVEAQDHGSLPRRARLYWVAIKDGTQDMGRMIQEVLDATSLHRPVAQLDAYLLPPAARQVRCRIPQQQDEDREYKYKDDHMRLYDEAGFQWPPVRTLRGLEHLEPRKYEVLAYCDTKWPANSDRASCEYLDCNASLSRLVGADGQTCPWSTVMPTMTASGQYLVRRTRPGAAPEFSQLDGIELLQMCGFSIACMKGTFPSHEERA